MSTIHIVVARANVSNSSQSFSRNMFVKKTTAKRMRGGTKVANVVTTDTIDFVKSGAFEYHTSIVGLALYDVGTSKTSSKYETILIKGVADVTLTDSNFKTLQDPHNKFIQILNKISGDTYRCFFDFTKNALLPSGRPVTFPTKIQPGLESTETHLAVTHEFDKIDNIKRYDVGLSVHFNISPKNRVKGFMLWPLTEKAKLSPKGHYNRAAVITSGVVTSFVEETDDISPLTLYTLKLDKKVFLRIFVLEVYERSIKFVF